MAKPFTIAVPDERLAIISAKVASFDWGALPDAGDWQSGVGLADLKRLVERVIFAHGRSFDSNGAAELKRAFEWLI